MHLVPGGEAEETSSGQSVCIVSLGLFLLADGCGGLHKRRISLGRNRQKRRIDENVCNVQERQRRRETREKTDGEAFPIPRGDEFTSCLFSATSATAKLTGPGRSGETMPITAWLTESFQQLAAKKKKRKALSV